MWFYTKYQSNLWFTISRAQPHSSSFLLIVRFRSAIVTERLLYFYTLPLSFVIPSSFVSSFVSLLTPFTIQSSFVTQSFILSSLVVFLNLRSSSEPFRIRFPFLRFDRFFDQRHSFNRWSNRSIVEQVQHRSYSITHTHITHSFMIIHDDARTLARSFAIIHSRFSFSLQSYRIVQSSNSSSSSSSSSLSHTIVIVIH